MPIFEKFKEYLLGKPKSVSEKLKKHLLEKLKYAAREFGKAGTRSDHQAVPKEQQLSIDLGNKKIFGIANKILHWVERTFKHLFPRYAYFSEIGTKEKEISGSNSRVKYFTTEEQAEHTKITYKGRLYTDLMPEMEGNKLKGFKGKPYDTTGETSKGEKDCVAYVITLDGKLVTHKHINVGEGELAYRHSTLAGGKPVLCSGLMKVKDGKITYIDNNSGHYKPTSANLYNAVKKLEGLFSKDAKIVYRPYWINFVKQIPFIRKIVPTKQEPVGKFLSKTEKKGKDGLTKYERYFTKMKEHNEQYRPKLFLASYKSPTNEPLYKPTMNKKHRRKYSEYINLHLNFLKEFDESSKVKTMTVEHSIRKIIGANYGHKPKIDIQYNEKEAVGVDIAFRYKDDCDKFTKLLDLKKHSYICTPHQDEKESDLLLKYTDNKEDRAAIKKLMPNKCTVFMSTDQANKFIKDTLEIKIDSVEQLGNKNCLTAT